MTSRCSRAQAASARPDGQARRLVPHPLGAHGRGGQRPGLRARTQLAAELDLRPARRRGRSEIGGDRQLDRRRAQERRLRGTAPRRHRVVGRPAAEAAVARGAVALDEPDCAPAGARRDPAHAQRRCEPDRRRRGIPGAGSEGHRPGVDHAGARGRLGGTRAVLRPGLLRDHGGAADLRLQAHRPSDDHHQHAAVRPGRPGDRRARGQSEPRAARRDRARVHGPRLGRPDVPGRARQHVRGSALAHGRATRVPCTRGRSTAASGVRAVTRSTATTAESR